MDTRRAIEGPAGILNSMSRSPIERNAEDMAVCAAAVESLREMRIKPKCEYLDSLESTGEVTEWLW